MALKLGIDLFHDNAQLTKRDGVWVVSRSQSKIEGSFVTFLGVSNFKGLFLIDLPLRQYDRYHENLE